MEFLLWACRSLHIFSAFVWIGGFLFIGAISGPVLIENKEIHYKIFRRFLPFVWSSIWTNGVTGFFLLVFNKNFELFALRSNWERIVFLKILAFLVLIAIDLNIARNLKELEISRTRFNFIDVQVSKLGRLNVLIGIITLLMSAALVYF